MPGVPEKLLYAAAFKARIQQHSIAKEIKDLSIKVSDLYTRAQETMSEADIKQIIIKDLATEQQYAASAFDVFKVSNTHLSIKANNKIAEILSTIQTKDIALTHVDIDLPNSLSQIARPGQTRLDNESEFKWGTSDLTYKLASLTMSHLTLDKILGHPTKLTDIFSSTSSVCQHVPMGEATYDALPDGIKSSKFVSQDASGRHTYSMLHTGFLWAGHRNQEYKDFGPHDASSFVKNAILGNEAKYSALGHSTRDLYFAYLCLEGKEVLVENAKTDWQKCTDGVLLPNIYSIVKPDDICPGDIRLVMSGVSKEEPLKTPTPGGSIGIVVEKLDASTKILECNRDMPAIEGTGIGEVPDDQPGRLVCYMRINDDIGNETLAQLQTNSIASNDSWIHALFEHVNEEHGNIINSAVEDADQYIYTSYIIGGIDNLEL